MHIIIFIPSTSTKKFTIFRLTAYFHSYIHFFQCVFIWSVNFSFFNVHSLILLHLYELLYHIQAFYPEKKWFLKMQFLVFYISHNYIFCHIILGNLTLRMDIFLLITHNIFNLMTKYQLLYLNLEFYQLLPFYKIHQELLGPYIKHFQLMKYNFLKISLPKNI